MLKSTMIIWGSLPIFSKVVIRIIGIEYCLYVVLVNISYMAHTQMVHDGEKCCLHMGKFLMLILILNQFSFGGMFSAG